MNPQRNYKIRVSDLLSADEIRKTVKSASDDTYFIQITKDTDGGPFAEFHGDPLDSDKITRELDRLAQTK